MLVRILLFSGKIPYKISYLSCYWYSMLICLYLVRPQIWISQMFVFKGFEVMGIDLKESIEPTSKMLFKIGWISSVYLNRNFVVGLWNEEKKNSIFILFFFYAIGNHQGLLWISISILLQFIIWHCLLFLYRSWSLNFIISLRCLSTSIIIILEWWMMGQ